MDVVFVSSRQRRRFRPTARRCPGWRCCLPNTRKVNWIQSRVLRAATFKGKHSAFDKDKHTPSTLARTGPRRASLAHLSLLGLVVSRLDCCHLGHLGHAGSAGTRVLCLCECFLGWSAGSARVGRDHLTRAPPRISHTHSLSHTHNTQEYKPGDTKYSAKPANLRLKAPRNLSPKQVTEMEALLGCCNPCNSEAHNSGAARIVMGPYRALLAAQAELRALLGGAGPSQGSGDGEEE